MNLSECEPMHKNQPSTNPECPNCEAMNDRMRQMEDAMADVKLTNTILVKKVRRLEREEWA